MGLSRIAEQRIREAMASGAFDNLSGAGKPVCHDAYFATPEDLRLGYSLLRSSGFVPEDVELLREAAALREKVAAETDAEERRALVRRLNETTMKLELLREQRKPRRRRP